MISFDLFDTLITRDVYKPSDIFYFVGKLAIERKLINKISPYRFMHLRIFAEKLARENSSYEEITIDDIYKELSKLLNISEKTAEDIKNIELELEMKSFSLIEENRKKFVNNEAIIITDTYLPKEFITQSLLSLGLSPLNIYVSSEYKKTKHSGSLFDEVLKNERYLEKHIGDNELSDFKMATNKGIHAVLYTKSKPTRYEKRIHDNINYEVGVVFSGIMKSTRLSFYYDDRHLQNVHEISSNVIAPFLFCYVYWVLKKALEYGIEVLYFVARDGQILFKIANIIIEEFNLPVKTKYLYASRKSLHLPSVTKIDEEVLDWIFDPTYFLSLKDICDRSGLSATDIKKYLKKYYNYNVDENQNLCIKERIYLRKIFAVDEHIHGLILSAAERERKKAIEYLKQEGFRKDRKIGIVDVGWRGRQQKSLSKILSIGEIYPEEGIYGFYVALTKPVTPFLKDKLIAFFSTDMYTDIVGYPGIYEIFVAADHGSCIGYSYNCDDSNEKSKVVPILRNKINKEALDWGLEIRDKTIIQFTKKILGALKKYKISLDNHEQYISYNLLSMFLKHPLPSEAYTLGRFKIYEDQEERIPYTLCEKFNISNIIKLLLWKNPLHHNIWIEGSITISFYKPLADIFIHFLKIKKKIIKTVKDFLK